MKLWILRPQLGANDWEPWYNKSFGFVVRAETEQRARGIANEVCGDEGEVWNDPDKASCEVLSYSGEEELIIEDFARA